MDSLTRRVNAHTRHLQALELRKAGATYQAIADQLGYASAKGAHKAVASALKATLRDPADGVRELELERLDAALLAIWRRVQAGDYAAIDRLLGIINSRAKLTGTFAPKHVQATVDWSAVQNVDVDALEDKLRKLIDAQAHNLAAAPDYQQDPPAGGKGRPT